MKKASVVETVKGRQAGLEIRVRRFADGRYGFDWREDGQRVKVRLGDKAEAVTRAREYMDDGKAGTLSLLGVDRELFAEFLRWKASRVEPARVPALVRDLMEAKEAKGLTAATLREMRSTLKPFAAEFDEPIGNLSRKRVEEWLRSRNIGPRRWNNMRASILSLYRFARRSGLLPAEMSPVETIERRKITFHVGTYTPDELRKLLAAVPREWLPLIALGAFCGLRPEEIAPDPRNGGWKPGLVWENILWDKRKVDVPAAVSKVRRRRFAVLTDAAESFLAPYRGESGPVVPGQDRHKFNRDWAKDAGISWVDNGLRHSYASYRLALTKDAPALALEMGNSPGMIFNHYLDLKHEDEAERWFGLRAEESSKSSVTGVS
jgi:integrase